MPPPQHRIHSRNTEYASSVPETQAQYRTPHSARVGRYGRVPGHGLKLAVCRRRDVGGDAHRVCSSIPALSTGHRLAAA
eukprot:3882010-Rhodomonas_salina.2